MFKFLFRIIRNIFTKYGNIIYILLFVALMITLIWQKLTTTYITAEFDELRPVHPRMNVFYKGHKAGRVLYIIPGKNYKKMYMKIGIFPNKYFKFPKNITVEVQREKDKWRKIDYVEINYPSSPSVAYIQNGTIVKGESTTDIETFLSSQDTKSLNAIKENLNQTVIEAQGAMEALKELFTSLNEIAQENKANLQNASLSLSDAAENMNTITKKLNRALDQEKLNNSVSGLSDTAQNAAYSTRELQTITKRINELTDTINSKIPLISSGIDNTGSIVKNLDEITCGVSNTLKKSFGGLRLIFGKTIDCECEK